MLGTLGFLIPIVMTRLTSAVDEVAPDLVVAVLVIVHGLVTLPALIVPLKGIWSLIFVCLIWSVAGLWIGASIDRSDSGSTGEEARVR